MGEENFRMAKRLGRMILNTQDGSTVVELLGEGSPYIRLETEDGTYLGSFSERQVLKLHEWTKRCLPKKKRQRKRK